MGTQSDFDCCMNGEHDETSHPADVDEMAAYIRGLSDGALVIIGNDRAMLWRRAIDTGDRESADHLESAIVELGAEATRRLTLRREWNDLLRKLIAATPPTKSPTPLVKVPTA